MRSAIYMDGQRFVESDFRTEEEFEKVIKLNSKVLLGSRTVYFDLKNKIETNTLGASIPDGFLFDFKDLNNPEFYLVEVELEKHDFDKHIFPQIKKFFAFFKNTDGRNALIGNLFEFIKSNKSLESEFKHYLGDREIYKTLKDIIESSQNILLIINEFKPEFEETSNTITEWAKFVKVEILKQYTASNKTIFSLNPDFENIESVEIRNSTREDYPETFHKEYVEKEIISIYEKIKKAIFSVDTNIRINPQRYYISFRKEKNFAFLKMRRKKLHIVIMLPFETGQKNIKNHKITKFPKGVEKFYGGHCFRVTVEKDSNLNEITNLLIEAYNQINK